MRSSRRYTLSSLMSSSSSRRHSPHSPFTSSDTVSFRFSISTTSFASSDSTSLRADTCDGKWPPSDSLRTTRLVLPSTPHLVPPSTPRLLLALIQRLFSHLLEHELAPLLDEHSRHLAHHVVLLLDKLAVSGGVHRPDRPRDPPAARRALVSSRHGHQPRPADGAVGGPHLRREGDRPPPRGGGHVPPGHVRGGTTLHLRPAVAAGRHGRAAGVRGGDREALQRLRDPHHLHRQKQVGPTVTKAHECRAPPAPSEAPT
eukprot:3781208-Pyramimonas_sp.AAC.2